MEFVLQQDLKKEAFLKAANDEVLIFSPSLELLSSQRSLLREKSRGGVKIKILVDSLPVDASTVTSLRADGVTIFPMRARIFSLFFAPSPQEIWIVDGKQALLRQLTKNSHNACLVLEKGAAEAAAEYFHLCWNHLKLFRSSFSFFVRHKKFSFQGGRAEIRELYSDIAHAQREVYLVVGGKISSRLLTAIRDARENGAEVTLLSSTPHQWKRQKDYLRSLGVEIGLSTAQLGHYALIDRSKAYFGIARFRLFPSFQTSFGFYDSQACEQFADAVKSLSLT